MPFQTFYLPELLSFAKDKNSFFLEDQDIEAIRYVRNWVAHNNDIIHSEKKDKLESPDDQMYDFPRLTKFVKNVEAFFQHYEILEAALK